MPAIVFDFDGVIVDSEPLHEAALRSAARTAGMDFTHECYLEAYVGLDDRDCFAAIAADNGRALSDELRLALAEAKRMCLTRLILSGGVRAFPGVGELARAAAASGPVAICSGALRSEIEPMLASAGLAGLFSVIVSADDVARAKPDPEGYRLASRRLGVACAECVAVEDTAKGVRAARDAGMRVVAVTHTLPRRLLGEANAVIDTLEGVTPAGIFSLAGLRS